MAKAKVTNTRTNSRKKSDSEAGVTSRKRKESEPETAIVPVPQLPKSRTKNPSASSSQKSVKIPPKPKTTVIKSRTNSAASKKLASIKSSGVTNQEKVYNSFIELFEAREDESKGVTYQQVNKLHVENSADDPDNYLDDANEVRNCLKTLIELEVIGNMRKQIKIKRKIRDNTKSIIGQLTLLKSNYYSDDLDQINDRVHNLSVAISQESGDEDQDSESNENQDDGMEGSEEGETINMMKAQPAEIPMEEDTYVADPIAASTKRVSDSEEETGEDGIEDPLQETVEATILKDDSGEKDEEESSVSPAKPVRPPSPMKKRAVKKSKITEAQKRRRKSIEAVKSAKSKRAASQGRAAAKKTQKVDVIEAAPTARATRSRRVKI